MHVLGVWVKCEVVDQTPPSQAHFLLNLASEEYSVVVDPPSSVKVNKPPAAASHGALTIPTVVKVIFRNSGRVIAIHAKRARGLMARYLAQHQITTLDGIKGFQEEGYTFQITESNGTTLVFDRPKQWNRATSDTTEKDNKTKTSSSVSSLTTTHHQKKRPRRSKPWETRTMRFPQTIPYFFLVGNRVQVTGRNIMVVVGERITCHVIIIFVMTWTIEWCGRFSKPMKDVRRSVWHVLDVLSPEWTEMNHPPRTISIYCIHDKSWNAPCLEESNGNQYLLQMILRHSCSDY